MLGFVLLCYLIGTFLGFGYLALERPWARQALGLFLALVFVVLDAVLVSAIPDATTTQRGLVASLVAIPLGALNQICKTRLGSGASAITGNLQGAVGMAWERVDAWVHHVSSSSSLGHEAVLTPAAPVLFLLGALAGTAIERAIDYSLTPLAPLFLLGLWASAEKIDGPKQLLGRREKPAAPTASRFTLALSL